MSPKGAACILAAEAAEEALRKHVDLLLAQAPLVRAESVDGVHDMRVASRRLRTVLQVHAGAFDPIACAAFLAIIRQITKLLGRPRELDVMIAMLGDTKLPLHSAQREAFDLALRKRRSLVSPECIRAAEWVEDARFEHYYRGLLAEIHPPRRCLLDNARTHLDSRGRKLLRAHQVWKKRQAPEDLHRLRIAFKKLRYTGELFLPHYGPELTAFVEQMKQGQQLLGAWNDCRVLYAEVMDIHTTQPDAEGVANALSAGFDARLTNLIKPFRKLAKQLFTEEKAKEARALFAAPKTRCCA